MPFTSQDPTFEQLIGFILNLEGGSRYTKNPKDPGGATKYGISINANKAALDKLGVKDIKELTEDQARQIYFTEYWMPSGANEVEDNGLCLIHFDAAVNHGVEASKKMLGSLSTHFEYYAGNGLNKGIFNQLCLEYIAKRIQHYAADRNEETFLQGWDNRLVKVLGAYLLLQQNPVARP